MHDIIEGSEEDERRTMHKNDYKICIDENIDTSLIESNQHYTNV